jgi:hypothetical protein
MTLQGLLLDSFRFFRNHLLSILLIIVPVVFPIELFRDYYAEAFLGQEANLASELPVLLIGLLAYPIYAGGIIFFISSVISGNRLNATSCWLLGLKYWGPFLLLSLILGAATGLGFVLFIVPGVIALVRFSFAEFDLLLKGQSPPDAMRSSWDETRPYFWLILSGYLVIFAAVYVPYFGLIFVLQDLKVELGIFEVLLDTLYAVLSVLFTVFRFRVYDLVNERRNLGLRPEPYDGVG